MSPAFNIRQITSRWLRSEVLADALTACLMAAGVASGLFRLFDLSADPITVFLISLLPAAILLLVVRFWRWTLLLSALGVIFLLVMWQLDQLGKISLQIAEFFRWALTWLQIGQPIPANILWFDWLRILIISILLILWLPLVRRISWPLFHGILLAIVFTPLLIAYPAAIDSLLMSLGGLIMFLPRRFVRLAHKVNLDQSQLTRAPLQLLALPAIVICLILSQGLVPTNTRNWRWPLLVNQVNDFSDLIGNQSISLSGGQPFSISAYGFHSEGSKLGGPVVLNHDIILRVTASTPVFLRGTTFSIYTGSSWQRAASYSYRFGSGFWRLLRQQTFGLTLPDNPVSRDFRSLYLHETSMTIEPLHEGMATVFTAGRVKDLSLAGDIEYPAYFNTLGDLFVIGGLPRSSKYTVTAEIYNRSQAGFDQALLAIEKDLAEDDNWPVVLLDYLQLPEDLPASVSRAAQTAIGDAASPYAKAVALEECIYTAWFCLYTDTRSAKQSE